MLESNIFYLAALAYAQRAWPVFPIAARGKRPLTVKGFKDATLDAAQIAAWWRRWPDANIGIPTGPLTFGVVDIDPRHGGSDSMGELKAKHGPFPETLTSATGGGGFHRCHIYREGFKNSANQLAPGIDTRGEGGYIVVPPSIHESGNPYRWINEGTPLAELPDWLMPTSKIVEKPTVSVKAAGAVAISPPPHNNRLDFDARTVAPAAEITAVERCRLYVAELPGAVNGAGGHNQTFQAACECYRFGLSDSEAASLLGEYNARCVPPWSDKELRHKLKEARKVVSGDGTFGERLGTLNIAHVNGNGHPKAEPDEFEDYDSGPAEADWIEGEEFPTHLLNVPGTVGEITNWIIRTSHRPQPILALGAALAFWGTVIGRKVRTETNLRSNVYIAGIAGTSAGKDHPRNAIKRLAVECGCFKLIGGERIASESGLMGAVHDTQSIVFLLDEFGRTLHEATGRNAPAYLRGVIGALLKLFTSASTICPGSEHGDRKYMKRKDIWCPNVSLFATTQAPALHASVTSKELENGMLGRLLPLYCPAKRPAKVEVEDEEPPDNIVKFVKEWMAFSPRYSGNIPKTIVSGDTVITLIEAEIVPLEPEAARIFRNFDQDSDSKLDAGGPTAVLWGRAAEHARKLAIIVACGCDSPNDFNLCVRPEVAAWACEFVKHVLAQFELNIRAHVSDSDFERDMKRISAAIRRRPIGISRSELIRCVQNIKPRNREECLQNLTDSHEIYTQEIKPKGGGPLKRVYRAADRRVRA